MRMKHSSWIIACRRPRRDSGGRREDFRAQRLLNRQGQVPGPGVEPAITTSEVWPLNRWRTPAEGPRFPGAATAIVSSTQDSDKLNQTPGYGDHQGKVR